MTDSLEVMVERQRVLADFGGHALRSDDLDEVLHEACRLVAAAMGTQRAKVLEIEPGGGSLLVRAGVGWRPGVVGHVHIPMAENTSESFSIKVGEPVITQDIRTETRFGLPPFLKDAGVVALVNVPVFLPGGRAYGLLQVDDTQPRDFDAADTEFLRTYATILGPVIDRLIKVRELRSAEERFRLTVESATDYAILVTDAEYRVTDWLPGAAAVFGWSAEEIVGQPSAILFTPEDRAAGEDRRELDTASREGQAPDVRWHLRKDGSRVFIEGTARALYDPRGALQGFLKIGQDVTERRSTEEALRESEGRLRVLTDGIPQLVWRAVDYGEWTWASPQWTAFTGQAEEASHGWGWLDPVHPDDRDSAREAWEQARAKEMFEAEFRLLEAATGSYRFFQARATAVRDNEGRIIEWLGTTTDVQDLREMHDRLRVLVAELQHRTRNLMAVILGVMRRTKKGSPDIDRFTADFQNRLDALGRVQGLLSRLDEGDRVAFDELIRAELGAMGALDEDGLGLQVMLDGPKGVRLRSSTVQTFALALHELATNAAKYGALAQKGARLDVRWRRLRDGDDGGLGPRLRVEWEESGVAMPEPGTPPQGGGYGRELIERALPFQLGAETTYELSADGVRCTITLPLSLSTERADA